MKKIVVGLVASLILLSSSAGLAEARGFHGGGWHGGYGGWHGGWHGGGLGWGLAGLGVGLGVGAAAASGYYNNPYYNGYYYPAPAPNLYTAPAYYGYNGGGYWY